MRTFEIDEKVIDGLIENASQGTLPEYDGDTGGECYDSGWHNGQIDAYRGILDALGIVYSTADDAPEEEDRYA